jgi:NAD-dependent deacetylase
MADAAPSLFILSGAGLSAESGVPTFRASDGLWEGHHVQDVATPEAYSRQPELVQQFYNLRRAALKNVVPNAAHEALARLDAAWPGPFLHVTQNVDDLNERAGCQRLIHMHGELKSAWCTACDARQRWEEDLTLATVCPQCDARGRLRPDIVWFGEMPYRMEEILDFLRTVDVFLCIGTSGLVYPAAGFASQAVDCGCKQLTEINLDPTPISGVFTERRQGRAGDLVPEIVEEWLASLD